jgi:peptidoglycan/xylan/chitin deacetylase (PgdA/CDA1 family)
VDCFTRGTDRHEMKILYALERTIAYLFYCTGIYWVRRRLLVKRGASVVLVYHRVLDGRRTDGEMVGEDAFEWQMRYLSTHFVPVDWRSMSETPEKRGEIRVLVTFDDGYRDNFTRALNIVEAHGVPSVFFVVTRFVFGRQPIEGDEVNAEAIPTIDHLRSAAQSDWTVLGNHTASHSIVSHLGREEIELELEESQNSFHEALGITPDLFAYPRGRKQDVTRRAIPVLEKHGIKAAFTMVPGRVDSQTDPYLVPRIGMSHVQDKVVFKVKAIGLLGPLTNLKNRLFA